jgi:LPS sulfotransferase NodH
MLTTPRSGSSWLASLCRSTGVMGHCREWLTSLVHPASPHHVPVPLPSGGPSAPLADEFLAGLRSVAGTPNGVYSVKIISSVWSALPAALAPWGIGDGRSDAWTARLFPRPAVLVLHRRDHVGQAISWWRAVQTGRFAKFVREGDAEGMPEYDFAALRRALTEIEGFRVELERAADAFARIPGAARLDVVYEDALSDAAGTVRRFAGLAGIEIGPSVRLETDLAVQRDLATAAIRRRFEADLAAAGVPISQESAVGARP